MKPHAQILTLLLAVITLTSTAQPQATWLERQHDFGVFQEKNGKVKCGIRLVNTGDEPLLIVKAQAGCGCTAITYPDEPIMPGDTATVGITYNPSGRPGKFTKQAIIFTNTEPKRTILEIKGNVIPTDATLDRQYPLQAGSLRISQRSIPFGELVKGKNKMLYLSAYNASTDTMLVHVTGEKPHIHPAIVPDTVPPAQVTALTVHYLSGHAPLWGFNIDTLMLSCVPLRQPSDVKSGSETINVMAQVMEDFSNLTDQERQDAPVAWTDCDDRIDFGTITTQETVTRTFTITNKGKAKLLIRRLWIPNDEDITITIDRIEIKHNKSATVKVTVNTSRLNGNILDVPLTLISNDPDSPRRTIRLVGIIDK